MVWRRTGDNHYLNQCGRHSLTHICGTRGKWVKARRIGFDLQPSFYTIRPLAFSCIQKHGLPPTYKCDFTHLTDTFTKTEIFVTGEVNDGSFNSSYPSAAYINASVNRASIGSDNGLSPIRRQAIIKTNAVQCWVIVNWTLRNKVQWNLNQNTKVFIHENAYENIVCEMAAILCRGS